VWPKNKRWSWGFLLTKRRSLIRFWRRNKEWYDQMSEDRYNHSCHMHRQQMKAENHWRVKHGGPQRKSQATCVVSCVSGQTFSQSYILYLFIWDWFPLTIVPFP
jgi:hypothetical protein